MECANISDFELIDDLCSECIDYLSAMENVSSFDTSIVSNISYNQNMEQKGNDNFIGHDVLVNMNPDKVEQTKLNHSVHVNIPDDIKRHDIKEKHNKTTINETIFEKGTSDLLNKTENAFKLENEIKFQLNSQPDDFECTDRDNYETQNSIYEEIRSERIKRLSRQLPKIIVTSTDGNRFDHKFPERRPTERWIKVPITKTKRRVTKSGHENVALISNIPFEKMRLLNDTFHTLINLRWRWIVLGTVLVHFGIWFVFAVFWYIAALAHDDFDTVHPPKHRCITGGTDFLNIFLASVEAQTTIGFGDRTIDEECPESIFLFIMQLIMGTGLSGVLTCVVYAKLTRPENFAKQGVGFSKKAVVSLQDGHLCLMFRAWDLNYDHIIGSEINLYFIRTTRTKEGEVLKHYAQNLPLLQRQLMLWPIIVTHVIDQNSPLYDMGPKDFINSHYEITVSLKGASASMGTYTQSQTSYLPREVLWGGRFPGVVSYSRHEQKYTIDHKNLHTVHDAETPMCSARQLSEVRADQGLSSRASQDQDSTPTSCPGTPASFTEQVELFTRSRSSSFRRKNDSYA